MKYRQHGYRDSERQDEREARPAPQRQLTDEERIQRRSLRKATDREANEVVRCHSCGRGVMDWGVIGVDTTCPHCRVPLHCCRACTHFDTSLRWQCRAEIKAPVADKNKANPCELFSARRVLDFTGRRTSGASSNGPRSNDPRSQFENLFKR